MLRDTVWEGRVQNMVTDSGVPKGLIQILKERGRYRAKMKLKEMRKEISFHPDFLNEKTQLQSFLNENIYHVRNNVTQVPLQAKSHRKMLGTDQEVHKSPYKLHPTKAVQDYTRKLEHPEYRKVGEYMFGYLVGHLAGPDLERTIKMYKSHRNITVNIQTIYLISCLYIKYHFQIKYLLLLLPSTKTPHFQFLSTLLCTIQVFKVNLLKSARSTCIKK